MNRGRPLKYDTKTLKALVDDYFETTDIAEWMATGLAIHLDTTRQTLWEWKLRDDEYGDTIKKALTKVEHAYERRLIKQGRSGDIFALKNFDWKDKNETELSGEGLTIKVTNYGDNDSVPVQSETISAGTTE